ncbi:hypothetical protein QNO07_13400 [Streptomyces sp. 549]|uniref:hypothetical protein n=1 Tax=Streptomyces sp. 549 TaxID=3049076 RepID=UPI0024C23807|nr:hypothetical protein [Streptomyces sp. 549]MDK1474405.1 hypothetical protein [Streptomyces sp. 549]
MPGVALAAAAGVLALQTGSVAAPQPHSDEGGKRGPDAPAGLHLSTELPAGISVDNATGHTAVEARVHNRGKARTTGDTLSVFAFDGLRLRGVDGCEKLPKDQLAEGSNSGYRCAVDALDAGGVQRVGVRASYDLSKGGRICLVVTQGTGDTLVWQQGPVAFGTENPQPNAPRTPLLLGTAHQPDAKPGRPALADTGSYTRPLALFSGALVLMGGAAVHTARRPREARAG